MMAKSVQKSSRELFVDEDLHADQRAGLSAWWFGVVRETPDLLRIFLTRSGNARNGTAVYKEFGHRRDRVLPSYRLLLIASNDATAMTTAPMIVVW